MNVIFLFVYFVIVMIIIANFIIVIKAFRGHHSMFNNIEGMIRQKINSEMQNNIFGEKKVSDKIDEAVNLDDFMKSNTNPVKEKRGKRSKI